MPQSQSQTTFIDADKAAELLKTSRRHFYRVYVETKKIKAYKFNRYLKFLRRDVMMFVVMMLLAVMAHGQGVALPYMQEQFLNGTGTSPAAGYKLCAYAAGTTSLQSMYTDVTLMTAVNPVVFSLGGFPTNFAFVDPTKSYKYVLLTAGTDATCNTGVTVWTRDNVTFNSITNYWTRASGKLSPTTSTDQIIAGASTTDSSAYVIGIPTVAAASTSANASTLSLEWLSANSTMGLRSGITGSGTYRDLSVWTNAAERFRFDKSGDFLVGLVSGNNAGSSIIEGKATNTNGTSIDVWNPSTGTTAYADMFVVAGAAAWGSNPSMHMGVTTTGYATAGAYFARMGFLQSDANATNGILVDAIAGPIALRSNGTTEMSITGGTGINAAHYVTAPGGFRATATAPSYPTANIATLNAYYDLTADSAFVTSYNYGSTTYKPIDIASSQVLFNISGVDTVKVVAGGFQWPTSPGIGGFKGNLQITNNGAPVLPTANLALLNLYYDGTADSSFVTSYNYGTATYKPFVYASSSHRFNVSGTDVMWMTATGPQWKAGYSTVINAGAQTLTMSNMSFPGSSPGNPCFMVTVVSSSGQVGYVPAFC